jgi:hypothetical protein
MLNPSGAATLGGAAAVTAAQPDTPPPQNYRGSSTPPLPVILVWLAVIGLDIYLLLRHDHNGHGNSPT